MKTTINLFMFTLFFAALQSNAAVKTTVADGNWYDAANWSPTGVPFLEDTVLIAHHIIVDDTVDMAIDYLIINADASLASVYAFGLHGNLINNGLMEMDLLAIGDGDFSINNGEMDGLTIANGNPIFTNNGDIFVDSVSTGNDNYINNGTIDCTILAWGGTQFDNYGIIQNLQKCIFGEAAINHPDALISADSINLGTSLENSGVITGLYLVSGQDFTNFMDGSVTVDDIIFGSTTLNDGQVFCTNLTTASGTVSGNGGTFCIAQCWINVAALSGTIDFCDATPSTFCDVQMGTIGSSVTFCSTGVCSAGNSENHVSTLQLFPNPAVDQLTLQLDTQGINFSIQIISMDGQVMLQANNLAQHTTTLDVSGLPAGNYICRILGFEFLLQEKLIIVN